MSRWSLEMVLAWVGGMIAAFALHFLWNLWLAPYRAMEERLNEIEENKGSGGNSLQPEPIKLTDFADYINHKNIELFGAACLWIGLEPHYPLRNSKAKAKLSLLKSAIRSGDLSCQWKGRWENWNEITSGKAPRRSPNDDQPVSMIALRKYADTIRNVPPFLEHISVPRNEEEKGQSGEKTS